MKNLLDSESVYLKTAARRQIAASGGAGSASLASRVNQQSMSNYQNQDRPECHMPVDVAVGLMRDSGEAHMLEALCRLMGGYFVPRAETFNPVRFHDLLSRIGKEIGDVFSASPSVFHAARDEHRVRLVAEIDEAVAALLAARESVAVYRADAA